MKYLLAIWIVLLCVMPARAAVLLPPASAIAISNAASGVSNNTITVPTSATNGHPIVICVVLQAGQAIATFGSGGTNPWTNLDSAVNTVSGSCAYKVVTTGDPTTYTPTWVGASNGSFITMVDIGLNTDGSTPVLDAHTIGSGQVPTQAALTTTVNGDDIIGIEMNTGILLDSGHPTTPMARIQTDSTGAGTGNYAVVGMGQEIAGLVPTVTMTVSSGSPPIAETIAFKADQPQAAMFVGVGAASTNSGSASLVTPSIPSNAGSGDTAIATILEGTTVGISITPPPVIALRGCAVPAQPNFTSGNLVFNRSAFVNAIDGTAAPPVAGDMLVASIVAIGAVTLPSGFTQQTNVTWGGGQVSSDTKLAGSSEPSSYTFSVTGNNMDGGSLCAFYDTSGGVLAIGATSGVTTASATSSTGARITTLNNNAVIWNYWVQNVVSPHTVVLPSAENKGFIQASQGSMAQEMGWFNQHTAGLTAQMTASSADGTSGLWNGTEIEIYSPTAASLSASTAWAQVSPTVQIDIQPNSMAIDPTGVLQLSVYYLFATDASAAGAASNTVWKFASNPSVSDGLIAAFGNLAAVNPVDSSSVLASANNASSQAPSITPTMGDMLLFYPTTPGKVGGFGSTIFDANLTNRIGLSYASLANIGTQTNTSTANTGPFVTYTLGLQEKAH